MTEPTAEQIEKAKLLLATLHYEGSIVENLVTVWYEGTVRAIAELIAQAEAKGAKENFYCQKCGSDKPPCKCMIQASSRTQMTREEAKAKIWDIAWECFFIVCPRCNGLNCSFCEGFGYIYVNERLRKAHERLIDLLSLQAPGQEAKVHEVYERCTVHGEHQYKRLIPVEEHYNEMQELLDALKFYSEKSNYEIRDVLSEIASGDVPEDCEDKDAHVYSNVIGEDHCYAKGKLINHVVHDIRSWGESLILHDLGEKARKVIDKFTKDSK